MHFFRLISVSLLTVLTLFFYEGSALAKVVSVNQDTALEGPEREENTTSPKKDSLSQLQPQTPSPPKNSNAYKGYTKLRGAGIALTFVGGVMAIAGGALMIHSYSTDYGDDELGCGFGADFEFLGGSILGGTGLVFAFTPGLIMTIAGQRKMKKLNEQDTSFTQKTSFQPKWRGVSLISSTSASGSKTGGVSVNFSL